LARRHPNEKSEGILDGPTPTVRPDLRRDMVSIPKISSPKSQERERERCGVPRGNVFTTGVHSPKWGTQFPGTGAS
jgi:hypothetical protein